MSELGPPVPGYGPLPSAVMILGEAPGDHETERGRPFVGPSGQELRRMLQTIGADLDGCYRTNTFACQPPGNSIESGYGTTSGGERGLGPLTQNPTTYLASEHSSHLHRLYREIADCDPNVILALGNTACWALGLGLGINALRGSVHLWQHPEGRQYKVLPTFHPAAVLRQYDLRVIAIADLEKAFHVEALAPTLNFDNTELWLCPTLGDILEFGHLYMDGTPTVACDVETKRGQITCVSFAPLAGPSLCIPFWQEGPDCHYWPDLDEELEVWRTCRQWLEDPSITKVMQNGLYDVQYFAAHGIYVRGFTEDTMLQHHSLYCELRKGLGFLASTYLNVPHWKDMRTAKREEQLKRDE